MYMAEAKVRQWSEIFHNAYLMCIFACDRTVYQEDSLIKNTFHYVAREYSSNQAFDTRIMELQSQIAKLQKKENQDFPN